MEENKNQTDPAPEKVQGGTPKQTVPTAKKETKKAAPKKPATETPKVEKPEKSDPLAQLAKEYSKLYPANKTFHITSDRQVFLDKNKGLAEAHQRTLEGGAITSITV